MQQTLSPMIEKIMQLNPVLNIQDLSLRRLLDRLPFGVYTCDVRGMLTSFNRQAVAIWGRVPQLRNALERFCGSHRLYSAADGTRVAHADSWMARALREERGFNECEVIVERPDGRRFHVLAHANPAHDSSGHLIGACNVLVDITRRKAAAAAPQAEPVRVVPDRFPAGQPPHVLFVDDDDALVEVMQALLTKAGYRVTASTHATGALALFEKNPQGFALVLSDIRLPGMSGLDLCREILRRDPTQPVALLSGHVSEHDHAQARLAGVRHILEKPLKFARTLQAVEEILKQPRTAVGSVACEDRRKGERNVG